jgi:putative flippase GtrA
MARLWQVLNSEFAWFLVVGGINTVITLGIYWVANWVMSYQLAYGLSYLVGIVVSYVLNSWWVFKQALSWQKFMQYPLVYVVQYGVGALILHGLVEWFSISQDLSPMIVVILTIPLTFVLVRFILKGQLLTFVKRLWHK